MLLTNKQNSNFTQQPTHEGYWTRLEIPDKIPLKVIRLDGIFMFHGFSGLFKCSDFGGWVECLK